MPAAQFAGIFFIIIKILFVQEPVLITDQPVTGNFFRIKFHLQFHIFCDRKQGATKFIYQNFLGFIQSVNIGMIPISLIRQQLHFIIFIISHSIPKYCKINSFFPLHFNDADKFVIATGTDIKITIRTKDHTVISGFHKILIRKFIRKLDTRSTRGRSTCFQFINRIFDGFFIIPTGRIQDNACTSGIHNNGDYILFPKLIYQQF